MAFKFLEFPAHTITSSNTFKQTNNLTLSSPFTTIQHHYCQRIISYPKQGLTAKWKLSSFPKPPTTKEEAILQAKVSISSTLEKPLNNPIKLASTKIKKVKQPRFRVEIPVIDDSASSLAQLALDIFGDMSAVRKKGSQVRILILWSNPTLAQAADRAFDSQSSSDNNILVQNIDMPSLTAAAAVVPSADVVVFLAPEASQLETVKTITDKFNPRPAVMLNPKWGPEEEADLGRMSGFVGSFDVIYSFMGLEVRGILSKRKGVVFKCAGNGGAGNGQKWGILVEEEEGGSTGELRLVSSFRERPSMTEVENVLYNIMAVNSPVTKSAKFLKNLISNVTGGEKKK